MNETIKAFLLRLKITGLLILDRLKEEPVLVRTTLALLVGIGIIELTPDKVNQIEQIVLIVLVLLGSASARNRVKPLTEEELNEAKVVKADKRIARVQRIKKAVKPTTTKRGKK